METKLVRTEEIAPAAETSESDQWGIEACGSDGAQPVVILSRGSRRILITRSGSSEFSLAGATPIIAQAIHGRLLVLGRGYGVVSVHGFDGQFQMAIPGGELASQMYGSPVPHPEGLAWPVQNSGKTGWWITSLQNACGFVTCESLPADSASSVCVGPSQIVLSESGAGELLALDFSDRHAPRASVIDDRDSLGEYFIDSFICYDAGHLTVRRVVSLEGVKVTTARWPGRAPRGLRVTPAATRSCCVATVNANGYVLTDLESEPRVLRAAWLDKVLANGVVALSLAPGVVVGVGRSVSTFAYSEM